MFQTTNQSCYIPSPSCHPQVFQGLSPEGLVEGQGHHQLRHFRPRRGEDGADAAVVQRYGAARQQPGMRRAVASAEDVGVIRHLRDVIRWCYPLVNIQQTMERSTIFNGKTHYFDWAIFNSYVSLPEGNGYSQFKV